MKVLLVAPYKKSYLGLAKFPPIGLGYLASALCKKGFEVRILDCLKDGIDASGYSDCLKEYKPGAVGINSWSMSVNEVREMLALTKSTDERIVTVVGGPHPSAAPAEAMEFFSKADYGFKGEAEIGLPILLEGLKTNNTGAFERIPGLIWRHGKDWKINDQVYHEALDDFDYLSWDLIKPEEYNQPGSITSGRTAPIITTRGCPYLCTFCSPHIIAGRKVRRRSAGNIIAEIKRLKEEHGMRTIAIMDENFTFHREHATELCEGIINQKLNMRFFLPNGIRLDTLDERLLLLMRKAGFIPNVAVGIESGSERILRMIKKNLSKETVKEKIRLMIKCGFRPIGYFILGFPTETKEEMYETYAFARELKLYRAAFSPLLILPSTGIYKELQDRGSLPKNYDYASLSTDNITRVPEGMSEEEFFRIKKDIIWKFNLQPRVLMDYSRDLNSFIFASLKFSEIFLKRSNHR